MNAQNRGHEGQAPAASSGRSRTETLREDWRNYFRRVIAAEPAHPQARDFMNQDLQGALARLIPGDASVLEVGCGRADLLASLPNRQKAGFDMLPEVIEAARARHPDLDLAVADIDDEPDPRRFDAVICDRLAHSVLDVRLLLSRMRQRLNEGGRIYLVTFNYLWEVPSRLAEQMGWKVPSPTANWFSESDFDTLFDLTDLEVVRYEDRLLLPMRVPGVSDAINRFVARVPGWQRMTLYRVYVLRAREVQQQPEPTAKARGKARTAAGAQAKQMADARNGAPTVSIVIPARNEAGNILGAVERTAVMGGGTEIIFIEGGSKDDTWDRIQQVMADYRGPLRLSAYRQSGTGKGDAVRLGFAKATGDILMILDADLTVPPEDLPVFYSAMVQRRAEFVQGTRLVYPMEPGAMRMFNKMGNVAFSLLFSYLLQQPIKDTLCGTKVMWRRDYERIAAGRAYFGDFDPFGDFDLIFGAARLNLKIAEIPVRYRDRAYGETNIQRWKHGWLLLKMSAVAARKLKYV